jgi:hypothetical protein
MGQKSLELHAAILRSTLVGIAYIILMLQTNG